MRCLPPALLYRLSYVGAFSLTHLVKRSAGILEAPLPVSLIRDSDR